MQSLLVLGDGASIKSDSVLKVGGAASDGAGSAGGSTDPAGAEAAGAGAACTDAGADMWRCEQ